MCERRRQQRHQKRRFDQATRVAHPIAVCIHDVRRARAEQRTDWPQRSRSRGMFICRRVQPCRETEGHGADGERTVDVRERATRRTVRVARPGPRDERARVAEEVVHAEKKRTKGRGGTEGREALRCRCVFR